MENDIEIEGPVKVRVTTNYKDLKNNKDYVASNIRYISCQRTRELLRAGVIAVMEIRRCKDE